MRPVLSVNSTRWTEASWAATTLLLQVVYAGLGGDSVA
jgi:hypothetical protein